MEDSECSVNPAQAWHAYELTYSPGHLPSGVPRDKNASRQVLAERLRAQLPAPTADAAVAHFERQRDCMVTACERVQ